MNTEQAQGDAMVSCRSTVNCSTSGDDVIGLMTARECCMENPGGLAYTISHPEPAEPLENQHCTVCIGEYMSWSMVPIHSHILFSMSTQTVFGFFQDSFVGVEQRSAHTVLAGYKKGATQAGKNLVFNTRDAPGTASESIAIDKCQIYTSQLRILGILSEPIYTGKGSTFDYTVNTNQVRALFRRPDQPDSVVFNFNSDDIAQEPNETLILELVPTESTTLPTGNAIFFQNSINMIITDSDSKTLLDRL